MEGATFEGQRPPFAALPVWLRGQLDPQELAVLWTLQSFYPEIRPGAARLARECKIGRSTLFNVLARLEKRGLIARVHRTTTAGDPDCNLYRLQIWGGPPKGSAPDALPSPADGLPSAPCGPGVVQQMDGGSPAGGHKEDQMNKNKIELDVEGKPSPASGGTDRPAAAAVEIVRDPQHQQPAPAALAIQTPPDSAPKRKAGSRKPAAFSPTAEDIDVRLLPVERQILAFWSGKVAGKKGATTKDAWLCLQAGLLRIQQDPEGGTHVVAEQLDAGIQAGWSSVTYANWQRYGKPARVRYGSQTAAPRGPDAWDAVTEFANWRDSLQQHTPEPVRYAV